MFQDHIEGKMEAHSRTAQRPNTGEAANEDKKRGQSRGEKETADEIRSRKNESMQSGGKLSSQNSRLISAKTPSQ